MVALSLGSVYNGWMGGTEVIACWAVQGLGTQDAPLKLRTHVGGEEMFGSLTVYNNLWVWCLSCESTLLRDRPFRISMVTCGAVLSTVLEC